MEAFEPTKIEQLLKDHVLSELESDNPLMRVRAISMYTDYI